MNKDIKDSDLVIQVTTEDAQGVPQVLSFPLAKVHLNTVSDRYGFQKGMHNTYNIVYNNSKMILSLSNWTEVQIDAPKLGQGTEGETPVVIDYTSVSGFYANCLAAGNHIYHTFLGEVAENNNGAYRDITVDLDGQLFNVWQSVMQKEAVYPKIMVARNLAAGGAAVPWRDETTGVLTAKQACVEFRDGGYTDWRLPRIGELLACIYKISDFSAINLHNNDLWSATEYDATTAYSTSNYNSPAAWIFPAKTQKIETLYVRCVRNFDKPTPII